MKRKFIFAILLVCSLLCACGKEDTSTPATPTTESATSESATPTDSPPYYETINLISYRELASFVIPKEAQVQASDDPSFPDNYKTALSKMITEGIPIPCKGGEPAQLREPSVGYSCITVFPRESYSAPAIQYDLVSGNEQFWIRISLEQDISGTFADEDPGSDIVRALAPSYPNLHNAEDHTDRYSYIGERIITTSNGDKNALYRFSIYNKERFIFMQNGYVVEFSADPDVLTDEWFEDFSIELMPVFDAEQVEARMSRDQVHQLLGTPDRVAGYSAVIDQYDLYNDDTLAIGYHSDHEGTPRVIYSFTGTAPYDVWAEKGLYEGMSRSAFSAVAHNCVTFKEYAIWWGTEDWIIIVSFNGDTVYGFDAVPFETTKRSPETFAGIQKGMSMFEVVARLGGPEEFDSDCTVFYATDESKYEIYWTNDDGAWVVSDIVAPGSE